MSRRSTVFGILGAVLLVAFYFGVWPFIVGGPRMEDFCRSLAPGLSVSEVTSLAAGKGYRLRGPTKEQRAIVHDPGSMGRFLCEVEFRDSRLVTAKYAIND